MSFLFFKSKNFAVGFAVFVFIFFGVLPDSALAVLYQPGETLNPLCAPTDINCGVILITGGNIIPDVNNVYDLGSPTRQWRDLYLSGNTLHLGSLSLSASASTGALVWSGSSIETTPSATSASEFKLFELAVNGANYIGFKSPDALAANLLYILPSADGTDGQTLSTNGGGALSWVMREPAITIGATTQYFRGDKTFQTLDTSVVPENGNVYYTSARFDSSFAGKSTSNLAEGTNLYWTTARGNQNFASNFSATTTDALAEGSSNKYYTDARFDNRLALKTTSDLTENSNLYWTQGRFDTAFFGKNTTNLTEGGNLYYSDARARSALSVSAPLSYSTSTGAFSILQASSAANGYLSSADWAVFNNKQTSALNNSQILIGNASNIATGATISGDAAISNAGVLTISNDAVVLSKLAADAVNSAKIVDGSIALADLASGSVDGAKITDATITNADVSTTAAILYSKLALGNSIILSDLTADSVNSSKVVDGSMVAADLASDAITSAKILDGTITNADVSATAAIALSKLASGTSGQIIVADASGVPVYIALSGDANVSNAGALTIANLAITNAKLAADSVTSEKILDGTIVAADIGADAVITVKILDGNITTAKILDANVTLAKLSANSVDSSKIVDGAIVSADISATAGITNAQLANSTIGLALGTSGTDVNVLSPAALGNSLTLNIPDAGATARGLVTTSSQTFAGDKTFSGASTLATATASSLTLSPITQGSLLFAGAGGLISQNNSNLFWDNTNNRLGVGALSPNARLYVKTSDLTSTPFYIEGQDNAFTGLSGWFYRKPVVIDNTANSAGYSNQQTFISIDTAGLINAGKLQSNCADLRFTNTDGASILSHWIEYGCNSATTGIWVKIPTLPAGITKTIYAYYGNPTATSTSSGAGVFTFFDDFPTNQARFYNTEYSGWTVQSGSWIIPSGNYLANYYGGDMITVNSPSAGIGAVVRAKMTETAAWKYARLIIGWQDANNYYAATLNSGGGQLNIQKVVGGVQTTLANINASITAGTWYEVELRWVSSTTIEAQIWDANGNSLGVAQGAISEGWTGGKFGAHGINGTSTARFENYMTLQYAPNITSSIGAEESSGAPQQLPFFVVKNQTGKIGIGEANPGAKLSVSGGLAIGSDFDTTSVSDGNAIFSGRLGVGVISPTNALTFAASSVIDSQGALSVTTASDGALSLTSNGSGNVVIDSGASGALNIGAGANGKTITLGNTTVGTTLAFNAGDTTTGNINFDNGTLYVDTVNNRVGVGTASPGAKLHIVGISNTAGFLFDIADIGAAAVPFKIAGTDAGTASTVLSSIVLTNNTTGGNQNVMLIENAAGSGVTDALLKLNNADTDTAVVDGLLITSANGLITDAIDVSGTNITNAINIGGNKIVGDSLSIDGDGNVGIGTATPSTKLSVVGDGLINSQVAAVGAGATQRGLQIISGALGANDGAIRGLDISATVAGTTNIGDELTGLRVETGAIDANGTTRGLHIVQPSTVGAYGSVVKDLLTLERSGGTLTNALQYVDAGATKFVLNSAGNVGLGTTTPSASLHIVPSTAAALRIDPFTASTGSTGELRFQELAANGANYTGFKSPDALAANVFYTLPNIDGAANQVLSTNGAGVLAWATASSSSQWTTSGSNIYYNTGNVAIGTSTPSATARLLISGAVVSAIPNSGLVSGNGAVDTTTVSGQTIIKYETVGTSTFTPPTGVTSVEYLVVAGGGGGGSAIAGGGGAGGLLTGTITVAAQSYSITVGGGGSGGVGASANGANGSNSVFSTITATGGGGGAASTAAGITGGSGGGVRATLAGGLGTSGQGNNGGTGVGQPTGSGGGGAVNVGSNATASAGGAGGNGATNTISGNSVTYAGGGGGGGYVQGGTTAGAGGTGGGGAGGVGANGTAGTSNTGGGGGGGGYSNAPVNYSGGNGGSGVVIVRFATQTTAPADQALLRVTDTGTAASAVLAFFEGISGQGCIIAGQTTSLACSSDISLKKNVKDMDSSLGNVLALKPVTYDWNSEETGASNHVGFIAQDVEKIYPGLVIIDPNGKKALAYDRFAPILVKAIQEIASLADSFKQSLITWFADAANGITDFFAKKIHTEQICLKKSDGNEYCVNGDNLEAIMNGRGEVIITNQESILPDRTVQAGIKNQEQGLDLGQQEIIPIESAPMEIAPTELDLEEFSPAETATATTTEEASSEPIFEPVQISDEPVSDEPAPAILDSTDESNAILPIETAPTETAPEITSLSESLPVITDATMTE